MDKAAILALADRVEALTGPCFNIEDQIEEVARLPWRFPPPNYTASLDAAMTLVPGTTIAASFDWPPGIEGATCGAVLTLVTLEGTRDVKAVSCTPAAAITAAALRAIAGGEDAN